MLTPDKFWARVDKSGACWLWTGSHYPNGYGKAHVRGKRRGAKRGAHRVAWEFTHGPIPNGLCVLHRCDNPGCVRPDRLFLGTMSDNMVDCVAKGRHQSQR